MKITLDTALMQENGRWSTVQQRCMGWHTSFFSKNIHVSVFWILLLIYPEFQLRNLDLWFTRLNWNSMTVFFVILQKIKENTNGFLSLEPNYHMNMLMIIIYKYFQHWILLISSLYLVLILSMLFKNALHDQKFINLTNVFLSID